jgi:phage protein D
VTPGSDHNVALYSVSIDGADLDEATSARLREVKVQSYLRLPDMCTLAVVYPKAIPGEDQPIDSHPFDIGKQLEVKLGAADALTTTTLFKGQIVSLEMNFGAGGVELLCRGFDRSHVLIRSRHAQTFQNMTSSDIVEKVVQAAGFTADCDSSGDPHDFMQQDNETDWDFIWRLAERVGFEFVVEDTQAHFRKPVADDPVELEWPTTLRSFAPRVTATQQVSKVTLSVQDPKSKQAINSTQASPNQIAQIGVDRGSIASAFDEASVHIASEPVKTQAEADAVTQALLDKLANGYIAAEGLCDGDPKIKAGVAVQVTGIGTKYSGTYRVAAATHVLRGGSTYETKFANSPAHTLLGSVGADRGSQVAGFGSQLVLGVVTNNQDPDQMGRVRVKYPALGTDEVEGTWARVASVSAGNARGLIMLPQAGEEVLVGFEHDDTTRPYVLGSLFNGTDAPGDDLYQSQDGSFALLSDQKIVATSKDEMKLTATKQLTVTGQDKIEVDGSADIALTAQQNIKLEASQQDISIKSDMGNVTIEGMQSVTIKCGPSSIQIGPSGVTVSGPMISLG